MLKNYIIVTIIILANLIFSDFLVAQSKPVVSKSELQVRRVVGLDAGIEPGVGGSISLLWSYTSITIGYYKRYIKKLSISEQQLITSVAPCTEEYKPVIHNETITYVWRQYQELAGAQ
jgi:hypothetical protein